MIVSLRSPTRPLSASPNAGAYGEFGSTHAPLSAPVRRKFFAAGSVGGNVSGTVVTAAGTVVWPGAALDVGPLGAAVVVVAAVVAAGLVMRTTSRLRTTTNPATSVPAARKLRMAARIAPVIASRSGHVRPARGGRGPVAVMRR